MSKFILFGTFSGTPALLTYKAVDLYCRYVKDACSGNIKPAQIACTVSVWILCMLFFYALEDEFENVHVV